MAQLSGISYKTNIRGISDRNLLADLKAASDSLSLQSRPPSSLTQLKLRTERDKTNFLKVLKAQGYYGAQIKTEIFSTTEPVQVIFRIQAGPPYLIKSIEFDTIENKTDRLELPKGDDMGLALNEPIRTQEIQTAKKKVIYFIKKQGFPFPKIVNLKVVVNHIDYSASLTFIIDPGSKFCFGQSRFSGLISVNETFVQKMIPWKEGALYDPDLIRELQDRMIASRLFSTVRVLTTPAQDESGRLTTTIEVIERDHRTIGLGINYKTDEGPGAKISWEHRNLFQKAERVTLTTSASSFTRELECDFRKPYFLRNDQSLNLLFRIAADQPDAYTSRNIKSAAVIEKDLSRAISLGFGMGFKASRVEQIQDEDDYRLLFIPAHFKWDTSDSLFDPVHGDHLFLQLAPCYDLSGSDSNFLKGSATYRHYMPVLKSPFLVLAGKVGLGMILGADLESIPPDERFYAGGGGSVRGYAYQHIGPLKGDDPIGGRSLVEVSAEARLKLTERFGLVGFLDGGNVFCDRLPDLGENLLWGTGLGLRYYTPIGPLRIDGAVPLDRRDGVDDKFQFYVGLGQAF